MQVEVGHWPSLPTSTCTCNVHTAQIKYATPPHFNLHTQIKYATPPHPPTSSDPRSAPSPVCLVLPMPILQVWCLHSLREGCDVSQVYLLHGHVLSSYVLQMYVWKAHKLQGYLCIAREYVWCDSDGCVLQGLYQLGMSSEGEYWLPKYYRGRCKLERTTDFATL